MLILMPNHRKTLLCSPPCTQFSKDPHPAAVRGTWARSLSGEHPPSKVGSKVIFCLTPMHAHPKPYILSCVDALFIGFRAGKEEMGPGEQRP